MPLISQKGCPDHSNNLQHRQWVQCFLFTILTSCLFWKSANPCDKNFLQIVSIYLNIKMNWNRRSVLIFGSLYVFITFFFFSYTFFIQRVRNYSHLLIYWIHFFILDLIPTFSFCIFTRSKHILPSESNALYSIRISYPLDMQGLLKFQATAGIADLFFSNK